MTKRELRRLEAIKDRIRTLELRVSRGTCTKLDGEKQELSALKWAVELIEKLAV